MPIDTDKTVAATAVQLLSVDKIPRAGMSEQARAERQIRAAERAELARLWTDIEAAGGREEWIDAQLVASGLRVDEDPAELAASEKASFKARKRAEAVERKRLAQKAWAAYRATHVGHVGAGVFYSDDLDEENRERDARLARAKDNGLLAFDSPEALAKGLGVSIPALRWLAFHREVETRSHYQCWTIPKRDGSLRTITAPKRELKAAQRWLLHNVFEKLPVHQAAHGFLQGRSIVSNALAHAGADVIVKVDIKDFFPTVTFRRIKGLLRKAGLPEHVATLIALISTEPQRELVQFRNQTLFVAKSARVCPQGAPTSPAITNAICLRMDRRMSGLAKTLGFTYTRYADDLAFSFRVSEQAQGEDKPAIGALLRGIKAILKAGGFALHPRKTTVMRGGMSQRVTGLVVNRAAGEDTAKARVPRVVVRRLEAAIFNRENGRPAKGEETLAQLRGMAAFVHMTDPQRGRAFLERLAALEARTA